MSKSCLTFLVLTMASLGVAGAQDKGKGESIKASPAQERVKVEVALATEHVPVDLKVGAKVDLRQVTGATITANGQGQRV